MTIEETFPPNFEAIKAAFPAIDGVESVVFTYGDTLHNPHQTEIRPDLLAHEEVHVTQQGADPAAWWERYLSDPAFRLEQEVAAYAAQYRFAKGILDNSRLKVLLDLLAGDLAGPGYGDLCDVHRAHSLIRHAAK